MAKNTQLAGTGYYDDEGNYQSGVVNPTVTAQYLGLGNKATAKADEKGVQFVNIQPGEAQHFKPNQVKTGADGKMYVRQDVWLPTMQSLGVGTQGGWSDFLTNYGPLLAAGGLAGAAATGAGALGGVGAAEGATGGLGGLGGASGLTGAEMGAGLGGVVPEGGLSAFLGASPTTGLAGGGAIGAGGAGLGATGGILSNIGAQEVASGGGLLKDLFKDVKGTNVLSGVLQGGLGVLGAGQQADAIKDVTQQNLALGAPYRDLLNQSYGQNFDLWSQPGYEDALTRAADISSRSWSAKAGNPAGSPTAQAGIYRDVLNEAYLPALSNYRGQLGQFGGLGLNTAGQAQLTGAQQAGSGLDALGYGVGTALNQQPDWTKILQGMGGNNGLSLNIGGMPYGGRR